MYSCIHDILYLKRRSEKLSILVFAFNEIYHKLKCPKWPLLLHFHFRFSPLKFWQNFGIHQRAQTMCTIWSALQSSQVKHMIMVWEQRLTKDHVYWSFSTTDSKRRVRWLRWGHIGPGFSFVAHLKIEKWQTCFLNSQKQQRLGGFWCDNCSLCSVNCASCFHLHSHWCFITKLIKVCL